MIKGLCTVSTGSVVNLLVEGELPEVGHYYYLESATEGTSAQNKTFHALVMEYFKSGQHSYDCSDFADFKNQIKRHLGAGFEGFVYIDIKTDKKTGKTHYKMFDVKKIEQIPLYIREDPDMKDMIRGKLKSWSNYTKKQRKNTIDNVISEMHQAGVNTPKFEEILKGLS
jgi:hypothetical protein